MIYKVYGGWTTHERYSVDVVAKSEKEAEKKANKIPIKDWEELQAESDTGFVIDSVDEQEDE